MNQQQLEKYLTSYNNRLWERFNRNHNFRLSKEEGRKLIIEARKRIKKQESKNK